MIYWTIQRNKYAWVVLNLVRIKFVQLDYYVKVILKLLKKQLYSHHTRILLKFMFVRTGVLKALFAILDVLNIFIKPTKMLKEGCTII